MNTLFRIEPVQLTRADIARNVAALDMPEGWTAGDDVALMEGLFRGLKLMQIGAPRGKTLAEMQDRFWSLRRAAIGDAQMFTLDAQRHLLEIVRERVAA